MRRVSLALAPETCGWKEKTTWVAGEGTCLQKVVCGEVGSVLDHAITQGLWLWAVLRGGAHVSPESVPGWSHLPELLWVWTGQLPSALHQHSSPQQPPPPTHPTTADLLLTQGQDQACMIWLNLLSPVTEAVGPLVVSARGTGLEDCRPLASVSSTNLTVKSHSSFWVVQPIERHLEQREQVEER